MLPALCLWPKKMKGRAFPERRARLFLQHCNRGSGTNRSKAPRLQGLGMALVPVVHSAPLALPSSPNDCSSFGEEGHSATLLATWSVRSGRRDPGETGWSLLFCVCRATKKVRSEFRPDCYFTASDATFGNTGGGWTAVLLLPLTSRRCSRGERWSESAGCRP